MERNTGISAKTKPKYVSEEAGPCEKKAARARKTSSPKGAYIAGHRQTSTRDDAVEAHAVYDPHTDG